MPTLCESRYSEARSECTHLTVIALCGEKGVGKTTAVARVMNEAAAKGEKGQVVELLKEARGTLTGVSFRRSACMVVGQQKAGEFVGLASVSRSISGVFGGWVLSDDLVERKVTTLVFESNKLFNRANLLRLRQIVGVEVIMVRMVGDSDVIKQQLIVRDRTQDFTTKETSVKKRKTKIANLEKRFAISRLSQAATVNMLRPYFGLRRKRMPKRNSASAL